MIRKDVNKYWVSSEELLKLLGFEGSNLLLGVQVRGSKDGVQGIDLFVEQWANPQPDVQHKDIFPEKI